MTTKTGPTKTEVRSMIRDIREALRHAEAALGANDMAEVAACLGHWAAPSAATIADDIAQSIGIEL